MAIVISMPSTLNGTKKEGPPSHSLSCPIANFPRGYEGIWSTKHLYTVAAEIFLITRIHIKPTVVIADEKLKEKTLTMLEKAEKYCLISNSMKTEVTIELIVLIK